jgi:hypothetical protein
VVRFRPLFTNLGLDERDVAVFYVFYSRIDEDKSDSVDIYVRTCHVPRILTQWSGYIFDG